MKKILNLLLAVLMLALCSINNNVIKAENEEDYHSSYIDLEEILQNPENYPDVEIKLYDAEEYVQMIKEDTEMPNDKKQEIISEVMKTSRAVAKTKYATVYDTAVITSSYQVRPYFYMQYAWDTPHESSGSPCRISKIQYANLDRNYNGSSKQFSGILYYNLESGKQIFWDLNGDFFNNGTTTVSFGATVSKGENSSTSFGVSYSSNHYKYIHTSKRIVFNIHG